MLSTPTFLSDIMYAPHCIPIWNHKLFVVTCNTLDTAVPQRNKACNILFGKYLLFSSGKPTQCNKYTYNRLSKWHWKCSCTNNSQLWLLLGIPYTIADPSLKTNLKSLARISCRFPKLHTTLGSFLSVPLHGTACDICMQVSLFSSL